MGADKKTQILRAAAELLEGGGVEGITTRAVQERAGVSAPTLYHHFRDKDGLVAALIEEGVTQFMARKKAPPAGASALDALRHGWEVWLEFALERPVLFRLLSDHARRHPGLLRENFEILRERVHRLKAEGRVACDADEAARLVWAASVGLASLLDLGYTREQVLHTSARLFDGVVATLARAPNHQEAGTPQRE